MRVILASLALLFGFLLSAPVAHADRSAGVWSKTGSEKGKDWVPISIACRQHYWCLPSDDVISERAVITTPNEWITGVCGAGGGAVDSCNLCLTNPPETACEWWLEGD